MLIFAQSAQQTGYMIGYWVGFIVGQLIGALILAAIVAGIFHLISMVTKKRGLSFLSVFPYAFVIILVLGIIGQLIPKM